jgi:hypothetical protein
VDQAKKQKVLIAILAVAGLGAGYYYGFVRESSNSQAAVAGPSTGRKERKKVEETATKETRKDRPEKTAAAPAPTGRKERAERPEADSGGRKARGKANTEINKKRKIIPAA